MNCVAPMAKILSDRDVQKLLGTVIRDADAQRINPNGVEIRLGKHVLFQSTGEEKEIAPGHFLKVSPGESVLISSCEFLDFTNETVHKLFPGQSLMAFITPTTTMMREGIMQSSTKVDSGFKGVLNWGIRNSSIADFYVGFGEPLFKLTIFLLDKDESPDISYGGRDSDRYQGTAGIASSTRKIPAIIPKTKTVCSSVEKLDPAKQLREAGYPFSHISTELTDLHGKFEVVSKDVLLLKNEFQDQTKEIRDKIETESNRLSTKVGDSEKSVLKEVENLFDRKFLKIAGATIGCIAIMFGLVTFLQGNGVTGTALASVALVAGGGIFVVVYILTTRKSQK